MRPEQTASIRRAYGQQRPVTPWKAWYYGPNFRQEKPQKGRYRQFDQVGAEVIGSYDPELDVELIAMAVRFYQRLGLRNVRLLINSLGDKADRPAYLEALVGYFSANLDQLSEQSQLTLAINPLRVLDSKRPQDAALIAAAPILADYLSDDAADAFRQVQAGLDALGITYEVAPRLVRGLDYYTRTTFEFAADSLDAAQNACGGGGRYDGLVADLGGPDDPGVGFALGVERTLLACDAEGVFPAPTNQTEVWVVCTAPSPAGLVLTDQLREAGIRTNRTFDGRSMKAQMKAANRSGAPVAVIVGDDELAADTVSIRPMQGQGEQTTVPRLEMMSTIAELLGAKEQDPS
ncbi:MAG: histidine--tRNA ligase [Acidimicrobiales bacterium]